jgi:hypothetical protein
VIGIITKGTAIILLAIVFWTTLARAILGRTIFGWALIASFGRTIRCAILR